MIQALPVAEFLAQSQTSPRLDVRTPAEFAKGRITGAVNLPLFSDEERAIIGLTYKHQGQQEAILKGLDFVGPKLRPMIEQVVALSQAESLFIHCWRGGMRSLSVAQLMALYGYQVSTLVGGYKAFRRYVLESFERSGTILILGGKTGSGKTEILQALARRGEYVVDLEKLANHKGSAFGALGQEKQPTQQQFENDLALAWRDGLDKGRVWLEDESRFIGPICLPQPLHQQMRTAPIIYIDVPFDLRLDRLVAEYGHYPPETGIEAISKIRKRLGNQHATRATNALKRRDLRTCCAILLEHYYDKTYLYGLSQREASQVRHVQLHALEAEASVEVILDRVCRDT